MTASKITALKTAINAHAALAGFVVGIQIETEDRYACVRIDGHADVECKRRDGKLVTKISWYSSNSNSVGIADAQLMARRLTLATAIAALLEAFFAE